MIHTGCGKFLRQRCFVNCYRNLTDYHVLFAEGLRYADVPNVISESASFSSCGEKSVSHLDFTQRSSALPHILAAKMSIEPNYHPKKVSDEAGVVIAWSMFL